MSSWATARARCGSPGSSTRSASSAAGFRWIGVDAPGTRANLWDTPARAMASRKTPQEQVQSTLRDAVERTVSVGQQTRSRAQDAVDDLGKAAGRLRQQLEGRTPATNDDLAAIRAELRNLAKRIDKLEKKQAPKKKT